jgi:hypothetical protein
MIEEIARLPLGYTARFQFADEHLEVQWSPSTPVIRNPRARRKFLAAYQSARADFMTTVATALNVRIATLDLSEQLTCIDQISVAEPATRQ